MYYINSYCIFTHCFLAENEVIGMGGYGCRTQDSPACCLATVLRSVNAESIIPFDWLLSSMGADVSLTDSEDYLVSYM